MFTNVKFYRRKNDTSSMMYTDKGKIFTVQLRNLKKKT